MYNTKELIDIILKNDDDLTTAKTDIASTKATVSAIKTRVDEHIEDDFIERGFNWIAHRGLSSVCCENTTLAYVKAKEIGYKYVECDIQMTKDGVFVLFHDDTLDARTNSTGAIIGKTFSEIQTIRYDNYNGVELYGETPIISFYDFLKCCKQLSLVPVIEIKDSFTPSEAEVMLNTINRFGLKDSCIIISFSKTSLESVRAKNKTIKMQWLLSTAPTTDDIDYCVSLGKCGISSSYTTITEAIIQEAHSKKVEVSCYTCDDYAEAKRLMDSGIDYITTNMLI